MIRKLSTVYLILVSATAVLTLVYVAVADMPSMRLSRDGVPHLTPQVLNIETGEGVDLGTLVRHFQGD